MHMTLAVLFLAVAVSLAGCGYTLDGAPAGYKKTFDPKDVFERHEKHSGGSTP